MNLSDYTIVNLKKKLKNKEISAVELTKFYLERIEKLDPRLHAFLTVCKTEALSQAQKADQLINDGQELPLLGIPIALKDMYLTKNIRTTAGAKVLDNYIPQYDATSVERLKKAGAIIIGKNNQDAWAHGSSGENSDFGPTKNPWNPEFVPGGSSSGPAVSVSSNMCVASGGTDTGGSIRLPASFCNLVGLKPTYGRVSRYGIIAMASSLDSIGHLTKTVEDSALYLQITAGKDEKDSTTPDVEVPKYTKNLKNNIKNLKIGIPKEYFIKGLDSKIETLIKQALKKYEELGAHIIEISLPHTEYANACYYIIMAAEVSSNLARYDGIRFGNDRNSFGEEAKRRIMLGTYTLSEGYYDAYYKRAMQVRTLLCEDFNKAWKSADVIAAPISPTLPWKIGERVNDPLSMYLSDIFTVTANLVGIPGLSIPVGFAHSLAVGMQLLGPQFSESLLFQAGFAYEQVTDWHLKSPNL